MTSKRNYSMKLDWKNVGRAYGANLPISTKHAVNICRYLKGMPVERAVRVLKEVIQLKRPIPFVKYNKDMPHRKGEGFGPGRYPIKASKYILKVLENAINSAKQKRLEISKLKILHITAHRAISKEKMARYGYPKTTHVEIIIGEEK